MTDQSSGWEPDPRKMGNWASMFEPHREAPPGASSQPPSAAYDDAALDDAVESTNDYRPWTLLRGRSRPALMLELRRYEPRSSFWQGWVMPYPCLCAVEYMGDGMLALDFGSRKFVVEGRGLDQLARQLQAGSVVTITEFASSQWSQPTNGPVVRSIRKLKWNGKRSVPASNLTVRLDTFTIICNMLRPLFSENERVIQPTPTKITVVTPHANAASLY